MIGTTNYVHDEVGNLISIKILSDFFIQTREEPAPDGIKIGYQFLYDNWRGKKSGAYWQIRKKSSGGRWNNYDTRVPRNVIYFGVQRVVPHYERSTHKSYRGYFRKEPLKEEHRKRICTIAGRILGRTYDTFEKHTHSKYSLPITRVENVRYSGFNMGAGESTVFEILMTLFESGTGSLLVIDEIELGLHEQAQSIFMRELKNLCRDLHCQIICSTHSHVILNSLPPEGRLFLETFGNQTTIFNGISADYACGKLRGTNLEELTVFVEDYVAATIVCLGLPYELRRRVNVVPIGSASAVVRVLSARYLEGRDDCISILDGDKRSSKKKNISLFGKYIETKFRESKDEAKMWVDVRLAFLPSDETPERWLIGSCKELNDKSSLAETWGIGDEQLVEKWLEEALREQAHSEIYSISQASPTSATRGQNACNALISRPHKPKVGTTRPRAGRRTRGQTQMRGGG